MKKLLPVAAIATISLAFSTQAQAASAGITYVAKAEAHCTMDIPTGYTNVILPAGAIDKDGAHVVAAPTVSIPHVACNLPGPEFGIKSTNGALTWNGQPISTFGTNKAMWVNYQVQATIAGPGVTPTESRQYCTDGIVCPNVTSEVKAMEATSMPSDATITIALSSIADSQVHPAGTYQDTVVVWVGNS
jgi:hypothetical protein